MEKEVNKGTSSTKARIRFQLGHTCGVTIFKVLEQEGIERVCGEIFKGSNGWIIISSNIPSIELCYEEIHILGTSCTEDFDKIIKGLDTNKGTYNNILETFRELGSQGDNPPKEGDKVLVRNSDSQNWSERIYLTSLPKKCESRYITVHTVNEYKYKNNDEYVWCSWKQMKPIHENTFKEIREGILGEDLGTVFEVEFWLDSLNNNVQN
jgi:hypothetical protein